mmetsp:Transcript_11538/g.36660  ORF Transcript_11538/g.36660 Transcript_11538/m.36660 type:complete len:212 (+) Transcript_11538:608-1243(+)
MMCGCLSTVSSSLTWEAFTRNSQSRLTSTTGLTGCKDKSCHSTCFTLNGTAVRPTFASTPTFALTGVRAESASQRSNGARIARLPRTIRVGPTCARTAQQSVAFPSGRRLPSKMTRTILPLPTVTALGTFASSASAKLTTTPVRLTSATQTANACTAGRTRAPFVAMELWTRTSSVNLRRLPHVSLCLDLATRTCKCRVLTTAPSTRRRAR